MQSNIFEIAPDVYRISTYNPDFGIQFNQFLLKDDEPFLMHTGLKKMFAATLDAVATIIDPAGLRWIGFSHFESDECGALNDWLKVAPRAQALCSVVGAIVNVNDSADRPPRALGDNEVIRTGTHRLRFLATPHVPHGWDAGLFLDEPNQVLFCSDLFFQPGDPEPLSGAGDVLARAQDSIVQNLAGPLANDMPFTPHTEDAFRRMAELRPRTMAVMHGSSFQGDGAAALGSLAEFIRETLGEHAK